MFERLPEPGRGMIAASWIGTAVFTVTAVLSAITSAMRATGVIVALALFAVGCVVFLKAFFEAVERSRTEEIAVANLYFLSGSAPKVVRRHLLGSTAVQVVVAFATASARPFTAVAFGILVPMYGLGMAGMWAARHGEFPDRRKLRQKKIR